MENPSLSARDPATSAVLTKAVLRAGDHLSLSSVALAEIVGLSGSTITRMRKGTYALNPNDKAFELSALFVRLYRALDALVGGDDFVARKWLDAENSVLSDKPLNLIRTVRGLTRVLDYLDSRRALV
jgi:uncharacterized protein (DUF2384 family)